MFQLPQIEAIRTPFISHILECSVPLNKNPSAIFTFCFLSLGIPSSRYYPSFRDHHSFTVRNLCLVRGFLVISGENDLHLCALSIPSFYLTHQSLFLLFSFSYPHISCTMLFSRQTLLAGATIFSSLSTLASAKASDTEIIFDKCVTECVAGAGCAWNEPSCMCTDARTGLLDLVAACMYFHCKDEIRHYDEKFLDIIVDGCKGLGKAIPKTDIDTAEDSAKMFVNKLPSSTTSVAKPTSTAKVASTTTSESKKGVTSTSVSEIPAPTETSTSSVEEGATTTTAESTPEQTTLALATGTPTAVAGLASTSTQAAANSEPTDSSPFATVPDSGAMRSMTSWVFASLPLVAALMMR